MPLLPLTIIVPITDTAQFKKLAIQGYFTAAELGSDGNDSVIECGHVRTVDSKRIQKRLGKLAPAAMTRVDQALKVSLGL